MYLNLKKYHLSPHNRYRIPPPICTTRLKQVAGSVAETIDVTDWNDPTPVLSVMGTPANLIDTTGYIEKNEAPKFAEAMQDMSGAGRAGKMVAFYDQDDNLLVREASGLVRAYNKDSDDRNLVVAFWDVAHTTGSDIRISFTDNATLIVGRHAR